MTSDAETWRLEVANFPVHKLTFVDQTQYLNGILSIDCTALLARISEPHIIADIDIQCAHPGESCRIVHILDAVTPMVKVAGRSTVYPGFLGLAIPAGSGRNHRLSGAAVVVCGTFKTPEVIESSTARGS